MKYWLFFWPLFWEFQWILQSLLTVKKDSERGPESVFSHVWNRQFFCFCFFIFQNWQVTKVFPCYIHLDKLPLLIETATLEELREGQSETFDRLCIELDHSLNGWRALGKKCGLPNETLQKIETPFSCTEPALKKLKAKNPDLSLQKIRDVLSKLNRNDVLKEMECLPGNIYFTFHQQKNKVKKRNGCWQLSAIFIINVQAVKN